MLNIAEGTARFTNADRKHFYIISRGSAHECAAILEYLQLIEVTNKDFQTECLNLLEEISKILYSLVKNLSN